MSQTYDLDFPDARTTSLQDLVAALARRGATLPSFAAHATLSRALASHQSPPIDDPGPLIDLTPAQLIAHAEALAARDAINAPTQANISSPYWLRTRELAVSLDASLKADIRANITQVIEGLRPEFDAAAAVMRQARDLGVKPDDDRTTLFKSSDKIRTAWLATHTAAGTLDELLKLRQALSFVVGVEPNLDLEFRQRIVNFKRGNGSGINWAPTVSTRTVMDPYDRQAPWRRWLKLAPDLQLIDPAQVTAFDLLEATDGDLANRLRLTAARQAAEEGAAAEDTTEEPTAAS